MSAKLYRRLPYNAAFTIVEVMIAMAILAIAIGASILALTQMNKAAQASRLYTGAQAVAQNHLDDAFNADWNSLGAVAPRAPLTIGTHYVIPNTNDGDSDGLIAYYDQDEADPYSYSSTDPGSNLVPIYEEDPITNSGVVIMGNVRIDTTDVAPAGATYGLRQIVVTVNYSYDRRPRQVQLTSLRSSN